MLIHGDNLLALKALEQDYAGKVKCIYIDPPWHNTGNAFGTYDDDGVEAFALVEFDESKVENFKSLLSQRWGYCYTFR